MTTIELPPLPERFTVIENAAVYTANDLRAYARLAIEQDRARRGEPVAWLKEDGSLTRCAPVAGEDWLPLYASPQLSIDPADREQVRILLDAIHCDEWIIKEQIAAADLLRKAYLHE